MSNIPELRFQEFSEEWEEKKYENIYSFYTTNSLSRDKLNYKKGEVYNIHYGDIHTKFSTIFKLESEKVPFINSEIDLSKVKADSYCQVGDLVIADASEDYNDIGKTIEILSLNNKKTLAGLHTFLARPNKYDVSLGYMGYMLQSWTIRKQIMTIAQGTKVLSLSTGRLSQIKLNLPQKPEQQKIASFLTSVDKKIEQLTQKEQLLQEYKKGVMQKIFSGEIRFKDDDGNEFPEWESFRLGEITKFRRGSFPQPYGLSKWYDQKDGLPFVQVFDVDDNMKLKAVTKNKISKLAQPLSVFVKEDSIVLTIQGSIGRIALTQYDAYVDRTLLIFTDYLRTINKKFFIYVVFLLFEIEKRKAPGGTIKTITKETLTSFLVNLPCIEEQTKIANFLSSIDKKLELLSKQIEEIKEFKKGLLQKMFV